MDMTIILKQYTRICGALISVKDNMIL